MSTTVWQSQSLETPRISLEFLKHHAENLNSKWRRETRLTYAATAIAALASAATFFAPSADAVSEVLSWVFRIGSVLVLIASVYLCVGMGRRGGLIAQNERDNALQTLAAYRSELRRRRDYSLGAWRWSILPIVPALIVMIGGTALFDQRPNKWLMVVGMATFALVGLALGILHYRREGRKCQRELDALATLDEDR